MHHAVHPTMPSTSMAKNTVSPPSTTRGAGVGLSDPSGSSGARSEDRRGARQSALVLCHLALACRASGARLVMDVSAPFIGSGLPGRSPSPSHFRRHRRPSSGCHSRSHSTPHQTYSHPDPLLRSISRHPRMARTQNLRRSRLLASIHLAETLECSRRLRRPSSRRRCRRCKAQCRRKRTSRRIRRRRCRRSSHKSARRRLEPLHLDARRMHPLHQRRLPDRVCHRPSRARRRGRS